MKATPRMPQLVVLLSEVWTMTSPRDLPTLVELAAVAESAGADGVQVASTSSWARARQ